MYSFGPSKTRYLIVNFGRPLWAEIFPIEDSYIPRRKDAAKWQTGTRNVATYKNCILLWVLILNYGFESTFLNWILRLWIDFITIFVNWILRFTRQAKRVNWTAVDFELNKFVCGLDITTFAKVSINTKAK